MDSLKRIAILLSATGLTATSARLLDRRTRHRAERTEHAAVTRLRTQQRFAVQTLVIELASIRGHGFLPGETAVRAGQYRFEDDGAHRGLTCARVLS